MGIIGGGGRVGWGRVGVVVLVVVLRGGGRAL